MTTFVYVLVVHVYILSFYHPSTPHKIIPCWIPLQRLRQAIEIDAHIMTLSRCILNTEYFSTLALNPMCKMQTVSYFCEKRFSSSWKHIRAKVTPNYHLTYSKNGGNHMLWMCIRGYTTPNIHDIWLRLYRGRAFTLH